MADPDPPPDPDAPRPDPPPREAAAEIDGSEALTSNPPATQPPDREAILVAHAAAERSMADSEAAVRAAVDGVAAVVAAQATRR